MSNSPEAPPSPTESPSFDPAASRRDINSEPWWLIVVGIILAGGAYPLVLALFTLGYFVAVGVLGVILYQDALPPAGFLGIVTIVGIGGALGGVLWVLVVSLVTTPVYYLFLWSMRLRASYVWLGATLGGLVGFVAVFLFAFVMFIEQPFNDPWGTLIVLVLGPGLTTVFGQVGGAWGGLKGGAGRGVRGLVARGTRRQALAAGFNRRCRSLERRTHAAVSVRHRPASLR